MRRLDLNGAWQMYCPYGQGEVTVPGDYYSDLLAWGVIPDPYEGQNAEALKEVEITPTYTRRFTYTPDEGTRRAVLRFHGVDTLATVSLNGVTLGETDNCHCRFDYDVTARLAEGDNVIEVVFHDPRPVFAEHHKRRPLRGADDSIDGYQNVRKAHFMSGWDFAPEMVNAGLFRPVELLLYEEAAFADVTLRQNTTADEAQITVLSKVNATHTDQVWIDVAVLDPQGQTVSAVGYTYEVNGLTDCAATVTVEKPQLWYPNGLGEQPLYTVITVLCVKRDGAWVEVDRDRKTLGLRSLVVSTEKDAHGQEFTFTINGLTPFIMGANYIPEDCMPSRWSRQRTEALLKDCADAHFNMIRVWGGGFYPEEWFYDLCDELGLLVWQDVMYACCFVDDSPALIEATKRELRHNLWRISHRSCLALICGNNEIEEAMVCWGTWCDVADDRIRETYLNLFEGEIPACLSEAAVDTRYIPSSPTSGGGFDEPYNRQRMDSHDWRVFHGGQPYEVYREDVSRFLSEFGFQGFPSVKTVKDRLQAPLVATSPEMEYRNCCHKGNGYLMDRIGEYYSVPDDFTMHTYLTQRLQADSVDYAIRHLRRHRGICMGTLCWPINDCWPGISWASIDYDGRWKALQYAAKEFYAPHLLVLTEEVGKVTVSVANESAHPFVGAVKWQLLRNDLAVLDSGEHTIETAAWSAADIGVCDFSHLSDEEKRTCVVAATLYDGDGNVVSQQVVRFVKAKDFQYLPPHITATLVGDTLTLQTDAFADGVWLEFGHADCVFSRNGFSLTGEAVTVTLSRVEGNPSIEDLTILCLNDTI